MPHQISLFGTLQSGQKPLGGACSKRLLAHTYDDIISVENLLEAWKEFRKGKRTKLDVLEFQSDLIYQVASLHEDLKNKTYKHGPYHHFRISDPKPRDIHKASVRDRLLHHAIYRILYPFFDSAFIYESYSCRLGKGTHRAMNRFRAYAQKSSHNHTRTCWVLKCDIKKFFASIDHTVLQQILQKRITNPNILWLLNQVINSFKSVTVKHSVSDIPPFCRKSECPTGLPLGNLTSQLLVNIYMNEFDQWIKHKRKANYYIRYADDFVLLSHDKEYLKETLRYIVVFLKDKLKLQLHPDKVSIKTFASGVDFLGWVHFSNHRVLRTMSKKRMFRRLEAREGTEGEEATKRSYLGMLKYGNTHRLQRRVLSASIGS